MATKQRISYAEGVLTCEYPEISKVFKVKLAEYADAIQDAARIHGFKQKFGDAASGKSAAEKFAEVQLIHASLLEGNWERTATIDLTPLICEAVSRLKKIPLEKIQKAAAAKPEQVKTWSGNAQVKAEIAKIRAEKAAKLAKESKDEIAIEM